MNKNLKSFKKSILLSILFPLFFSITASTILFFWIYKQDEREIKKLSQEKLLLASHIFQSTLSEKLAIIANSTIFNDFITSGEITRKEIMPRFLAQLSTLNSKSIIGLKIWHDAFNLKKTVIDYGKVSKNYLTLKLCYLGTRLDNQHGKCDHFIRLYFLSKNIINELATINNSIQPCNNCQPIDLFHSDHFGSFSIDGKSDLVVKIKIQETRGNILFYYIIVMIILLSFTFLKIMRIRRTINTTISEPLENLVRNIRNNTLPKPSENILSEINYVIEQIDTRDKQLEKMRELEKKTAIGQLTAQLAHDIRSPLSALEMGIQSANSLPEDIRVLIRNAVWRIHDIANKLLQTKNQSELNEENDNRNSSSSQLLSSLINIIVSEKRLQYLRKPQIVIESQFDTSSYGLFSSIDISNFKRLISNLINNGVEALSEKGNIIITLSSEGNEIKITISDNGKGIPSELLEKLGQRGLSCNKIGGSGLGLYHAKTCVENWGGKFEISSTLNLGTTIKILLPKSNPPMWFLPAIKLRPEQYFVVIDDDTSIHEIWKNRIQKFCSENKVKILLKNFYFPNDIKDWTTHRLDNIPTVYLCDYEFIGQAENGLDIIKKLNIFKQSNLVTSRYEDTSIINECENLGVKIIPKDLASSIPLIKMEDNKIDAILIDDDSLIHKLWNVSAKKNKKIAELFYSHLEFLKNCDHFPPEIPIYIDSNLGNNIKGEEVASEIYALGFTHIYLSTGSDPSEFQFLKHIKKIVGKGAPWDL